MLDWVQELASASLLASTHSLGRTYSISFWQSPADAANALPNGQRIPLQAFITASAGKFCFGASLSPKMGGQCEVNRWSRELPIDATALQKQTSLETKEVQVKNEAEPRADKTQSGVAAVDRALAILAALEQSTVPRNLSEIARATDLHKSTILRILGSLLGAGYIMRVEESKYALGPAIMQLGLAYESTNPLRHIIMPVMERLVDEGTESPSFHIRQSADERLCLFRVDSRHSTLDRVNAGDRLPIRRGAAGVVLLAFGGENIDYPDLQQIREDCFAISLGERDKFCAGIAAPVFSSGDRLMGALSLSGPKERFSPNDIARMKLPLLSAALELTESLGGKYPRRVLLSDNE